MKDELRYELLQIYRDAEKDIAAAGPVCVASGRCCRFKEFGHVLYLSSIEAELLLEGAPPFSDPVSEEFCPFQKEKLCTAREQRPLGCRIYFCDPAYQETSHTLTESYLGRLKELVQKHGQEWRYAPLHTFLKESASATPLGAAEPPR
jgi:Fe-S-cluster containining protein